MGAAYIFVFILASLHGAFMASNADDITQHCAAACDPVAGSPASWLLCVHKFCYGHVTLSDRLENEFNPPASDDSESPSLSPNDSEEMSFPAEVYDVKEQEAEEKGDQKRAREEVEKKASSFVRIGREPSSEDLSARDLELLSVSYQHPISWSGRHHSFARVGGSRDNLRIKRASSFVRIGKDLAGHRRHMEEGVEDEQEGANKRASSFVRIRKASDNGESNEEGTKRASSFVRIGKAVDMGYDGEIEEEAEEEEEGNKRASSFVRIGKSGDSDQFDDMRRRASSFVRIGKSGRKSEEESKRASSFVRIGKSSTNGELENKRASSFVRIGKSADAGDEGHKRASSFVRIGKSGGFPISDEEEAKRASSFVRIGKSLDDGAGGNKRASSFVRIGKSPENGEESTKRASSFVRIGKSSGNIEEENKRASSFVRIGKSDASNSLSDHPAEHETSDTGLDKRASSFVRIG